MCVHIHVHVSICAHAHRLIGCQRESPEPLASELTPPQRAQHRLGSQVKVSSSAGVQCQTFSDGLSRTPSAFTISENFYTLEGLESLYLWGMAPERKGSPNSWGQAQVSNVYFMCLLRWKSEATPRPSLSPNGGHEVQLQKRIQSQWDSGYG